MHNEPNLIQRLSWLAKIELSEQEQERLQQDIASILQWVDQLQQVNTEGVQPMAHPLDLPQPLREDKVTETDVRQQYQPLAPALDHGLYLVPRVVE